MHPLLHMHSAAVAKKEFKARSGSQPNHDKNLVASDIQLDVLLFLCATTVFASLPAASRCRL